MTEEKKDELERPKVHDRNLGKRPRAEEREEDRYKREKAAWGGHDEKVVDSPEDATEDDSDA